MEDLVSIIMPTYNCGYFIEESIKSVLSQDYKNWELIIVDDGSKDHTKEIVTKYLTHNTNIYYFILEENSGPAKARSVGLKKAKGKFVAFLDSDDLWLPNKLSVQIDFMKKKKIAFSATGYEVISENGNPRKIALIPPEKTDYGKMLSLACPIGNLTVMYDRQLVGNQTVPNIRKRNDFALWLQILHKTGACYGIPEVLSKYRVRSQSISRNKLKLIPFHWHLYYNIEKLGFVKTVWYILCWFFVKTTGLGVKKVNL